MSEAMRESERIAGAVLARLYKNGLTSVDIDCHALAAELRIDGESEADQSKRATEAVRGVIEYLEAEGLIRIRNRSVPLADPAHFFGVQLTSRGLRVLNALPRELDEDADRRTLGDRMADAMENGKAGLVAQLWREFIAERA